MKKRLCVSGCAALLLVTGLSGAEPSLGVASEYNVFALEDINYRHAQIWGRVAAGGDAKFQHISIGSWNSRSIDASGGTRDDLVVRGKLHFIHGQMVLGNILAGGKAQVVQAGLGQGSVKNGSPSDFGEFEDATEFFESRSDSWAQLEPNGTATVLWGALDIDGDDPTLNVIHVDASVLSSVHTVRINTPESATTLINVSGSSLSMSNMGFFLNGQQFGVWNPRRQNVLINLPEATSASFSGLSLGASLLAPRAAVELKHGQFHGSFVVRSLEGRGSIHDFLFNGSIPTHDENGDVAEAQGRPVRVLQWREIRPVDR